MDSPKPNSSTPRGPRVLFLVGACALLAGLISWFTLPTPRAELPTLFPMPTFSLTSEQGEAFTSDDLSDQVVVVNFIFTRCPTICPMLSARMAQVQQRLEGVEGVRLVSFSVDPRHDTPEVLREYGKNFGQDPSRWSFLTGETRSVRTAVEEGFKVAMEGAENPDVQPQEIIHGEHFVLVDRAGMIRGYYQVGDDEGIERLVGDVHRLLGSAS